MLISSNYFISSANAYGSKIEVNSATALAKPNNQQQQGWNLQTFVWWARACPPIFKRRLKSATLRSNILVDVQQITFKIGFFLFFKAFIIAVFADQLHLYISDCDFSVLFMLIITGYYFISSADAYGCKIEVNSATALAKAWYNKQKRQTIYSCTPDSSSTQYEVHVLTVYEVINRRPPTAGNAIVNIVSGGKSSRPIVLVLGSYEPVNWILKLPAGTSISKVILVSALSQ